MLISQLIGKRFKERPADANLISHSLLLRGGYMRQVANGIYSLLPLGMKVIRKIEGIIRQEMDRIGGQEVQMPVVLPRELWDESGRYESVGSELVRFKDRTDHDMILAMTHEEAIVHLARSDVNSYRAYPFILYQMQTKFRDEPRSRGGLIRVREFTMKDAYSFHTSYDDLQKTYDTCEDAYNRIFMRVGIPEVTKVESDSGIMGGQTAHEFMLFNENGEDTIAKCTNCTYVANIEIATSKTESNMEPEQPLKLVYTPELQTIDEVSSFLSIPAAKTAKVVLFERDSQNIPVMAIIRGDLDVSETKIARIIGVIPDIAKEETVRSIGVVPSYASAIDINNCRVIADTSVLNTSNLVCGANKKDYHYLNFNLKRDVRAFETADIAKVREGDACPHCNGKLEFKRGIEVGNIFQLGTKYSEKMGMRYLDSMGKEKIPHMGCYGIGIGRLMASIIEARHDDYGPIWPITVAPFKVHITALNMNDNQRKSFSDPVYEGLLKENIDVIYDDREERPGIQFADADLIGAPLRLIFSSKNIDEQKVEWKRRDNTNKGVIYAENVIEFVKTFIDKETQDIELCAHDGSKNDFWNRVPKG